MFLQPKNLKFKKTKKGKLKRFEYKAVDLKFGNYGLKSCNSGFISARQLEAARRAVIKKLSKKGKLWIKIFPATPVFKKPLESRMGKGKGSLSHWAAKVYGGNVLFEVCGVSKSTAKKALKSGQNKLSVKTKFID